MTQPYPNPIGVHALVWTGGWSESEARTAIASAKESGYDLIEILLMDPASIDVDMTRRVLDEYDMRASGSLGLGLATDTSSDDPDAVAAGQRVLSTAVSVARDLGLVYLGGVLFGALAKYNAPVTPRGYENSVTSVAAMCEQAAIAEIPIGLELVNRYESNLLNTADQAMSYLADVGAANLYVHLDTYHMNIEESGLRQAVLACGDRLGYVHIGESHRGYLGSGNVDFTSFFRALVDVGYAGPITFESFSSAVVSPELSHTLGIWRNLWQDNLDLARHARAFIDGQLRSAQRAHGSGSGDTMA